ncbi:hypothetical protein Tco_0694648, partial [Tanacetum coccineum]
MISFVKDAIDKLLIKELKDLWGGVETFDACAKENFQLKAAV